MGYIWDIYEISMEYLYNIPGTGIKLNKVYSGLEYH